MRINPNEPLSVAMTAVNLNWAAGIIAFGSVVAHTAVLLVFQLGQPRILYAMSRDGLLPKVMAKTHRRFRTPHVATILTGLFVAAGSAMASLDEMADLCNIGTLVGIHHRMCRRTRAALAGPAPHHGFPYPLGPVDSLAGNRFLLLADAWAARHRLGTVHGVVDRGPGVLPFLRVLATMAGEKNDLTVRKPARRITPSLPNAAIPPPDHPTVWSGDVFGTYRVGQGYPISPFLAVFSPLLAKFVLVKGL